MATLSWDGSSGTYSNTWHRLGDLELARDTSDVTVSGSVQVDQISVSGSPDVDMIVEDFYIDGSLIENFQRHNVDGFNYESVSGTGFNTTANGNNLDIEFEIRVEFENDSAGSNLTGGWRIYDSNNDHEIYISSYEADGDTPDEVYTANSFEPYDFIWDYFTSGTWTSYTEDVNHTQNWSSVDVTCSLNGQSAYLTIYDMQGNSVTHSLSDGTNSYSLSTLDYSNKLQAEVSFSGTVDTSPSISDITATGSRHFRVNSYDGSSWNEAVLKSFDGDSWNDDVPHFFENSNWKQ